MEGQHWVYLGNSKYGYTIGLMGLKYVWGKKLGVRLWVSNPDQRI